MYKRIIIYLLCIIIFGFLLSTKSMSEQKILTEEELKKIDPRSVEKQKIERKTGGEAPKEEKIEIKEDVNKFPYQEIIIRKYKPNILFMESSGFKMGNSLAIQQQEKEQTQQTASSQQKQEVSIGFKGYCEPVNNYKISLYPVPSEFICLIKDLSSEPLKMTGKLKPSVGEMYLGFEVSKINGCSQIKDFYIIRSFDYSPNLYSDIDRKIIENAMLKFFTKTGSDVSSGVTERLKEPDKKTVILNESGVTIVDEQKQKTWKEFRDSIPYIAGANLTEALSKEILSAYSGRVPPIFYVNKGEIYTVEGVCVK